MFLTIFLEKTIPSNCINADESRDDLCLLLIRSEDNELCQLCTTSNNEVVKMHELIGDSLLMYRKQK
jgi:hypothetical protein